MAWCAESVAGQTSPVGATSNFNWELCCQKFRKIISYSLRMLDKLKENQVWTILYLYTIYFKMIFLSANFYVFQCHVNYITREASPMYPRPLHTSEIPCEAVGTKITLKCNSKFIGKGEKKTSRKNVTKKKTSENETLKNISKKWKIKWTNEKRLGLIHKLSLQTCFWTTSGYSSICWTPMIAFLKKFCTGRDESETSPGNAEPRTWPPFTSWISFASGLDFGMLGWRSCSIDAHHLDPRNLT